MTEDEIRIINIDKAKNNTNLPIIMMIFNLSTYIIPVLFREIDYGMILELASLILVILARIFMLNYKDKIARKLILLAILPIAFLIIQDAIILISTISNGIDIIIVGYGFYFLEILSISYIIILYRINKNLLKAGDPIKYRETTDWFYEELEKEKNEK